MIRQLFAFLIRDFYTEISYRTAFVMSLISIFFTTITFYYVSELLGESISPMLTEFNGDYFAFVLIGIAFGGYFGTGLSSFASGLRQAQTTGTLEALMMTPASLPVVIIGSAIWSYIFTTIRVFIYILLGMVLFDFSLAHANYWGGLVSLILSIIAFGSIGIISASLIMVIKRGNPITMLLSQIANLVGGIYYPVEILPDWLQTIARLLPITYAVKAMRLSLLNGASWSELQPLLLTLTLFCILLFPTSLILFNYAVRKTRQEGSFSQF